MNMTESFIIGAKPEYDTPGSRFYRVFCGALNLTEAPTAENDADEFWKAMCAMGLIAWNISFKKGNPRELIARLEKEYEIKSMPPAFRTIIEAIIDDRRASCADEKTHMKECRIENGKMIIEY